MRLINNPLDEKIVIHEPSHDYITTSTTTTTTAMPTTMPTMASYICDEDKEELQKLFHDELEHMTSSGYDNPTISAPFISHENMRKKINQNQEKEKGKGRKRKINSNNGKVKENEYTSAVFSASTTPESTIQLPPPLPQFDKSQSQESRNLPIERDSAIDDDRLKKIRSANASRRHRERRKEEVAYLRNKVTELQMQLQNMTSHLRKSNELPYSTSLFSSSLYSSESESSTALQPRQATLWEIEARYQRYRTRNAKRENAELRSVLANEVEVMRSLLKVLEHSNFWFHQLHGMSVAQRSSAFVQSAILESWKNYLLPFDRKTRLHYIEEIINKEYDKLHHIFIEMDMHDIQWIIDDRILELHTLTNHIHEIQKVHAVYSFSVKEKFCLNQHELSDMLWNMMIGQTQDISELFPGLIVTKLEMINHNTAYVKYLCCLTKNPETGELFSNNVLIKRFKHEDSTVLVSCNIQEDEIYPITSYCNLSRESSYMRFEQLPSNQGVSIKLILMSVPSRPLSSEKNFHLAVNSLPSQKNSSSAESFSEQEEYILKSLRRQAVAGYKLLQYRRNDNKIVFRLQVLNSEKVEQLVFGENFNFVDMITQNVRKLEHMTFSGLQKYYASFK